jgi:hypothetical protein
MTAGRARAVDHHDTSGDADNERITISQEGEELHNRATSGQMSALPR